MFRRETHRDKNTIASRPSLGFNK